MSRAKPMVLMLLSGEPARLHMALMTAAAAAAAGRRVTLFVSKQAVPAFVTGGWEAMGGQSYDQVLENKGVADLTVLADALRSLDVRVILCDASLAEHDLENADRDPRFHCEVGGLVGLMDANPDSAWLTF